MSHAFLRLSSSNGESPYSLPTTGEVVIGREPSCQIVLNPDTYKMVSRRHATVCSSQTLDGRISFLLCDLNSANGTYLNGLRLNGCQELHTGDHMTFGNNGPEFIFEYQVSSSSTMMEQTAVNSNPTPASAVNKVLHNSDDNASWSQMLPIISHPRDFTRKTYLLPGIITVVFVVLLFFVQGLLYQLLLGAYLATAAFYFIYQLCGKPKPWWVLTAAAIITPVLLSSPVLTVFIFVFRDILPGNIPNNISSISFPELFVRFFFGAGLLEELLKALPIIGFYFIGRKISSPKRERIGVCEPLDGILLGAASAVGFTLFETLGQYVPGTIAAHIAQHMGEEAGLLAGLQLLIPRILGEVAGHMAWSGWFGYCIGLSVLRPRQAWRILTLGYFSAALLHSLWDSSVGLASSMGILVLGLLMLIGGLSYALLAAAIVKARALSPTRSQNFATRFL
ncbi:MAG: PrsW family glutamic-type intramembrane protease [Rhizonema sp. PD38]|nr:PrsW family glutamic-type intramembrane protease [Rhizonema sp. PD38]